MSAAVDHAQVPTVREAQGLLLRSIFAHPAFDAEGDRRAGKLFFVFEETVAVNDALELAHLGDDADGSVRAALERAIEIDSLVVEEGSRPGHIGGSEEGSGSKEDGACASAGAVDKANGQTLLQLARAKYGQSALGVELPNVDLGNDIATRAAGVRDAARKVLGA